MNKAIGVRNYTNQHKDKMTTTLSSYIEKNINYDGTVNYNEVETNYFLENNKWHIDFFRDISQFKEQVQNYKYKPKNIIFNFSNPNINKEVKFIVYNKLFSDDMKIISILITQMPLISRLTEFINKKYPKLNSILDLELNKVNIEWTDWLVSNGVKIIKTTKVAGYDDYEVKSPSAKFLINIYEKLSKLIDDRKEWEKDIWDVRNLEQFGITYNKSSASYNIKFNKINNINIRNQVKKYIKQRLIANYNFSWSTAKRSLFQLTPFINFICGIEPN